MRTLATVAVLAVAVAGAGCTGRSTAQQQPDAPDAASADPQHYSVEFENDVIRVLRVGYGPGETSVMHRHPANCAIFITDATGIFTLPSGDTVNSSGTPGQVRCGDAEVHLPTNTGTAPFEVVVIELKDREVFAQ